VLALVVVTPVYLNAADEDGDKGKPKTEAASEEKGEVAEDAGTTEDAATAEDAEAPEKTDKESSEDDKKLPLEDEELELPVPIQCGTLTSAVLSESAVQWVVVDKALLAKRFDAPSMIIDDETELRVPGQDKTFALITVEVAPERSIGRYDYVLKSYGETFECLAIKGSGDTYDFRCWQIKATGVAQVATLLFEVRSDTTDGELTFTLDTTVPQPAIPLNFAEEFEPDVTGTPAETAEPSAAKPDAAAEEATGDGEAGGGTRG